MSGQENIDGNDEQQDIKTDISEQSSISETSDVGDHRMDEFDAPLQANKKPTSNLVNKRIDFDPKTLKRIEMMVPAFRDEVGSSASTNDVMSFIIAKGIDALFDGDFKKKIEEM